MRYHVVFTPFISLFLAACGSLSSTATPSETATILANDTTYAVATNTALDELPLSQNVVFNSSDNACLDSFNYLRVVDQAQFDHYLADYEAINQENTFLTANNRLQTVTPLLDKKLDLLCAKVQSAGFMDVKERLSHLSDL